MATIAVGAGGAVVISWPALIAAATVVVVIAIIVIAVVAFIGWLTTPSTAQPEPIGRRCYLRPEQSGPGNCHYDCYLLYDDDTMDWTHELDISLAKLAELLGGTTGECVRTIDSPL